MNKGAELQERIKAEYPEEFNRLVQKAEIGKMCEQEAILMMAEEADIKADGLKKGEIKFNETSDISLCMIVKDEMRTIKRAIASALPYVSEVCVLDTGSSDNTYHYLRALKVFSVEQQKIEPWDFSKARNIALKMATRGQILIVDGDEFITSFGITDPNANALYYTLITDVPGGGQGTAPRLFPNSPDFYFRGRVHNTIVHPPVESLPSNIEIFHDHTIREIRVERNVTMIDHLISKRKTLFEDYQKLCQLIVSNGKWDILMKYWDRGMKKFNRLSKTNQKAFNQFLLYPAFKCISIKDMDDWGAGVAKHVRLMGSTIDNSFCMFFNAWYMGWFDFAKLYAKQYLELCQAGVHMPHQSSYAIRWRRDVQFRYGIMGVENGNI